jgi:hypothetical protein
MPILLHEIMVIPLRINRTRNEVLLRTRLLCSVVAARSMPYSIEHWKFLDFPVTHCSLMVLCIISEDRERPTFVADIEPIYNHMLFPFIDNGRIKQADYVAFIEEDGTMYLAKNNEIRHFFNSDA